MYEPSKLIGDVFESIIGAIYIDGGLKKCVEVMKPILSPLIVYVSKFIKLMNSEYKEDLFHLSNASKLVPKIVLNYNPIIDDSTVKYL